MSEEFSIQAPSPSLPEPAPVPQAQAQQQQQSTIQTGAPTPRAKVWHRMQSGC